MTARAWPAIIEALQGRAGPGGPRGDAVRVDESMANHTHFRTGGRVRAFVQPATEAALVDVVTWLRSEGVPTVVLGAGANTLWADPPFDGVVVNLERCLGRLGVSDDGRLVAGAGVRLRRLLKEATSHGFGGFGFLAGIPGTVGGAVRMNAGTHLGCVADVLASVELLGPDGARRAVDAAALELAYRHCRLEDGAVILSATFQARGPLSDAEREAVARSRAYRKETQPLQLPTGGSVFRNPPEGPAAGALIEAAGLKGRRVGGARVSEQHANWIVHEGDASSADIRGLVREMQAAVERDSGITLHPEIHFLGPWPAERADGGPA